MAWRDPFVFRDRKHGRWHMLFAAKAAMPAGPPIATVGHAIAQDDDLEQWELQPPLQLPRHYRQLEVPSLVHRPGRYYLFVSTQNRPEETDNAAKQAAFRGYVAPSLLGPWEFIYGETDLIYGHKIYAPLVFERGQGSGGSTPRWPSSPRTPRSPSPPRPSSISSGRWTSTWGGRGPSLTLKRSNGSFEGAPAHADSPAGRHGGPHSADRYP